MDKADIFEIKRLRQREYRQQTGLLIVEGLPEVSRAVEAGITFKKLFVCPDLIDFDPKNCPSDKTVRLTKDEFKEIAFGRRLKGVLGVCEPHKHDIAKIKLDKDALVIVLDGVEKPGNLGTVIRSCDGAGVAAVVCCGQKTEIYNQHVVRSSIGSLFHVPVLNATGAQTIDLIKRCAMTLYVAAAEGDREYFNCDFKGSSAVVFGNEHHGVSSFFKKRADCEIRIPMRGINTSLNVAMSASVICFEADRQRRTKG